jgi:Ca2+-binding RTX toxin-like protein
VYTSPVIDSVFPIYSYGHGGGDESITGGYVYRGQSEGLQGQYFYSDFVSGRFWTLQNKNGVWVETDRTAQIDTGSNAVKIDHVTSFGQDALGNLYVTDFDGEIFRLTPQVASKDTADNIRGGAGNDMIFAGSGNDTISGDSGNDVLNGMAGNDTLTGGADNDTLVGGSGIDTADYSTASGPTVVDLSNHKAVGINIGNDILIEIENVVGGSGNDTIIGDQGVNVLSGGLGNDKLFGGLGSDTLTGGNGAGSRDTFVFDTAIGPTRNADTITDFEPVYDQIFLDDAVFANLVAGSETGAPISNSMFVSNRTGQTTSDNAQLVYQNKTGNLYYDPDGAGGVDGILFATLTNKPALTASDFQII